MTRCSWTFCRSSCCRARTPFCPMQRLRSTSGTSELPSCSPSTLLLWQTSRFGCTACPACASEEEAAKPLLPTTEHDARLLETPITGTSQSVLYRRLRAYCRMLCQMRLQLALHPVTAAISSSRACTHSSGNKAAAVLAAAIMPPTRQLS